PWSGKGGDQGPPDLDEVVRKLQERLGGLFGGKKGGGGGAGGPGKPGGPLARVGLGAVALVVLVIWIASGIYLVQPAERGVVMRFGSFQKVTQPGPHWHLPYPIEEVRKVDVDQIKSFRHNAQMLTRDENIVDVELTVQSRIQDPADYLFQDQNPEKTLRDATETAVRETIGKNNLDFVLTEGRSAIAVAIDDRTEELLNKYRTGLTVTSVNMQPAKPPEAVKHAFDDAIKAREDKERSENQAEAYANDILPKARGAAARRLAEANAYRDRVIAAAEGETARFTAVLEEFSKAPEVTRQRLYLDAVESVLENTNKVILDVNEGANLTYLPLDRLLQGASSRSGGNEAGGGSMGQPTSEGGSSHNEGPRPTRDLNRERRFR
ncbi:MAG: FtsH protease activity modulator HflK, partial [Chromatiales bacterium]